MDKVQAIAPTIVKTLSPGVNSAIYSLEAALYEKHVIEFNEEVNSETASCLANQLQYLNTQNVKEVTIQINSPGGDVVSGLGLLDIMVKLENQGMTIKTICKGMAASMASLLLMCGSKGCRYMYQNSTVMIHDLSSGSQGKWINLKDSHEYSTALRERLIEIVSKRTGKTTKEVEDKWFDARDHYMFCEEAIREGIIDEMISVDYSI